MKGLEFRSGLSRSQISKNFPPFLYYDLGFQPSFVLSLDLNSKTN